MKPFPVALLCSLLLNVAGCVSNRNAAGFDERVSSFTLEPEVKVTINAPSQISFDPRKKTMLICYALPNGNTTSQTIGHQLRPGDDWHFDIQQIGAQTRFLRALLPDRNIVVAYLEAAAKTLPRSWPGWRKIHGDASIPGLVNTIHQRIGGGPVEIVLSAHSGGGSFIFGYLNAVERIPNEVSRIAFLDSDYAYDHGRGYDLKLTQWLRASVEHRFCVLAYNDTVALLNGKHFVSAAGGAWGRTHAMMQDLGTQFPWTSQTNGTLTKVTGLNGRIEFLLKDNPERKILHTVQVERNGFIQAMVSGTRNEGRGYEYFGPRAYSKWIASK